MNVSRKACSPHANGIFGRPFGFDAKEGGRDIRAAGGDSRGTVVDQAGKNPRMDSGGVVSNLKNVRTRNHYNPTICRQGKGPNSVSGARFDTPDY